MAGTPVPFLAHKYVEGDGETNRYIKGGNDIYTHTLSIDTHPSYIITHPSQYKCTPSFLLMEFKRFANFPITFHKNDREREPGSLNLDNRNPMLHLIAIVESVTEVCLRVRRLDVCDYLQIFTRSCLPVDTFRIIAYFNLQNRKISVQSGSQTSDVKLASFKGTCRKRLCTCYACRRLF
jgi:hypothetical protein